MVQNDLHKLLSHPLPQRMGGLGMSVLVMWPARLTEYFERHLNCERFQALTLSVSSYLHN